MHGNYNVLTNDTYNLSKLASGSGGFGCTVSLFSRFSHKSTTAVYNIFALTHLTGQTWLTTEFYSPIYQSSRPALNNESRWGKYTSFSWNSVSKNAGSSSNYRSLQETRQIPEAWNFSKYLQELNGVLSIFQSLYKDTKHQGTDFTSSGSMPSRSALVLLAPLTISRSSPFAYTP